MSAFRSAAFIPQPIDRSLSYSKEDLDGGQLDNRYYTETELDALLLNKQTYENGFEDRSLSDLSFDNATRTVTIAPNSGSYIIHSGGNSFIKNSVETLILPDAEGLHYVYFDASGTLTSTQIFSDEIIARFTFVTLVYWDADNNEAIIFAEERHGSNMAADTHLYNHNTIGTRYGSGLQPVNITTDGSGDDPEDAQIGVSSGVIWDEDIRIDIPSQVFPASIPFFYKTGPDGYWRRLPGNTYVVYNGGGTDLAKFNEFTGATWQLTSVSNNDFLLMHLYATNDMLNPYIWVIGEQEYSSRGQAREGATQEIYDLELAGLPVVEYKAVASFIIQSGTGRDNAVKSEIVSTDSGADYIDWRFIQSGVSLSVSGALSQSIVDLNDTAILNPIDKNVLQFNGTNWVNVSNIDLGVDGKFLGAQIELYNDASFCLIQFEAQTADLDEKLTGIITGGGYSLRFITDDSSAYTLPYRVFRTGPYATAHIFNLYDNDQVLRLESDLATIEPSVLMNNGFEAIGDSVVFGSGDVYLGDSPVSYTSYDQVLITRPGGVGLVLESPLNDSAITFSSNDAIDFRLLWDHSADSFQFLKGSSEKMRIEENSVVINEDLDIQSGDITLNNGKLLAFEDTTGTDLAHIRVDSANKLTFQAVGGSGFEFEDTSGARLATLTGSGSLYLEAGPGLYLANNSYIKIKDIGGVYRAVIGFDPSDNTVLGNSQDADRIKIDSDGFGTLLQLNSDNTVDINADLTIDGTFTSIGIDDNANTETIEISDNRILFRSTEQFNILHDQQDGFLTINGGPNTSDGGEIDLFGSTHPIYAGDIQFRSNNVFVGGYDLSDDKWNFSDTNIVTSGNIIAPRFIGTADNSELLDNLNSSQFLRSDANDTYEGGTLSIRSNSNSGFYIGFGIKYDSGWKYTNDNSWGFYIRNNGNGTLSLAQSAEAGVQDAEASLATFLFDAVTPQFLVSNKRVPTVDTNETISADWEFDNDVDVGGDLQVNGNVNINGKLTNIGGALIEVQNGVDGGTNHGIHLWSSADNNWAIYMGQAGGNRSKAGHAACSSIDGRESFHVRSRVFDGSGNGFIWENTSEECIASLTGDTGILYTKGGFGLNDTNYLSSVTGQYGSVQVNGDGSSNWQGYSIDGRVVFMHSGSITAGIYDDVNNHWMIRADIGSDVTLYYDGDPRLETTSQGIEVNKGSGSVGLTTNDGYGNAQITFNHTGGIPDSDGSSARIRSDVDSTTARIQFLLVDDVTAGVNAGSGLLAMTMTTSAITSHLDMNVFGELDVAAGIDTPNIKFNSGLPLNDYDYGSFTPEVADDATAGNTATFTGVNGEYVKIGRLVHLSFNLSGIDTTGMNSGSAAHVRNLPFNAIGGFYGIGAATFIGVDFGDDDIHINFEIITGTNRGLFKITNDNANTGNVTVGMLSGNSARATLTYITTE